ncbi:MAG: acetyl-CoA decarbonylase/synthase complex subunit gamma [bacterium ADurb.Bin243]|nr:MAG: acetyl-CoA decarbonylase/synthase complex subunit gamma [bacterium ADurb.Bin243]
MSKFEEIKDFIISCRCVLLRYNPIRSECGLVKIGNPSSASPVFVSGNYFHTVKRLEKALRGLDCYLLVCDSAGINVWCASGVCDFNEHKIADSVNSTGLSEIVSHRRLILPLLSASGVDLGGLEKECGFKGVFGPADFRDIKKYAGNGFKLEPEMRLVRFAFAERYYNAFGMFAVFLVPVIALKLIAGKKHEGKIHFLLLMNFINIFSNFMLYDRLPFKYPANNSLFIGALIQLAIAAYSLFKRPFRLASYIFCSLSAFVINFLVSVDMLGSTPFYKTTIAHWLSSADNKSLFQPLISQDLCAGCGSCALVCPKGLFTEHGGTVRVDYTRECCECLACVKQCAPRAIKNKNGPVFKDDIKSIENINEIMN